jgi:hypothetical protein
MSLGWQLLFTHNRKLINQYFPRTWIRPWIPPASRDNQIGQNQLDLSTPHQQRPSNRQCRLLLV